MEITQCMLTWNLQMWKVWIEFSLNCSFISDETFSLLINCDILGVLNKPSDQQPGDLRHLCWLSWSWMNWNLPLSCPGIYLVFVFQKMSWRWKQTLLRWFVSSATTPPLTCSPSCVCVQCLFQVYFFDKLWTVWIKTKFKLSLFLNQTN